MLHYLDLVPRRQPWSLALFPTSGWLSQPTLPHSQTYPASPQELSMQTRGGRHTHILQKSASERPAGPEQSFPMLFFNQVGLYVHELDR